MPMRCPMRASVHRPSSRVLAVIPLTLAVLATSMAAPAGAQAPDAGTPEAKDEAPFIIPAGREEAVVAMFGQWWKAPVNDVAVQGVSIDRNRLVVKVLAGKAGGAFFVAHAGDKGAFPKGSKAVEAGGDYRVAFECAKCSKAERANAQKAVATWAAGAAAARDTVWAPRPEPRNTPEPGSLGNVPQGKSPEETRFAAGVDPSTQVVDTTAPTPEPVDGTATGTTATNAPAPGEGPRAAPRAVGRYVLLAALILLLVWLLRAPAAPKPATPEATPAAPSPEATEATAAAEPSPAADATPSPDASAAPTASPDGQTKPG